VEPWSHAEKRLLPYTKWMFEHLLPCHCYATKTNSRTIRQQVLTICLCWQRSELQSHHCMFEQINHIGTAVHGHPQLSLKWRLPNRIRFDVFDPCFCKVQTRACETPCSCAQRLGGLAVKTLPGASRSFNPTLAARIPFTRCRLQCVTVMNISAVS